jgi:hypothetical protein
VLLGRGQGRECSQIFPLACFRVFLARVKAKLSGFKFSNHAKRMPLEPAALAGKISLAQQKGRHEQRPFLLASVVVAQRAIISATPHATFLEICVLIRRGRDRFFRAFQSVLCRRELLGKPRLTLVSEGYPRRRLLMKKLLSIFLVRHGSLSFRLLRE